MSKKQTGPEALQWAAAEVQSIADNASKFFEGKALDLTLGQRLAAYHRLSEAYDVLDDARKRLYAVLDGLSKVTIPKWLEDANVDKVQVPEVGRSFYPLVRYSASIIDKPKGYEWLRRNNAAELIQETVNAQTLATFLKDRLLETNAEPPADIFKFSSYKLTGSSKYTPKEGTRKQETE